VCRLVVCKGFESFTREKFFTIQYKKTGGLTNEKKHYNWSSDTGPRGGGFAFYPTQTCAKNYGCTA
jgi:hypothetical protein